MIPIMISPDDLSGDDIRALVARHLSGMRETSPPDSVHALDVARLKAPGIRFWSARVGGEIAGMGALKQLDAATGEIKSMRVADRFLRAGVGRAILRRILEEARAAGLSRLYLETGSAAAFAPALSLYESEGFEFCGPFADYEEDLFSRFMTRSL